MDLGRFFLGLNVHDIGRSVDFYGILGFRMVAGSVEEGWAIVDNGGLKLGLFRGEGGVLLNFLEGRVREITESLRKSGVELKEEEAAAPDENVSFTVKDPDGNLINFSGFYEKGVRNIDCPRCGAPSEPNGKDFIFGVFEGRTYLCQGCGKSFNAFYKEKGFSHTVPRNKNR